MYNLTLEQLEKELERYSEEWPVFNDIFEFYRDIMTVVLDFRSKVSVDFNLQEEEIKNLLREGRYLLSEESLIVDDALYEELRDKITESITHKNNEMGAMLKEIWLHPALTGAKMIAILQEKGGFTPDSLEKYFKENGLLEKCGDNFEFVSYVVFSALSPFYLEYARQAAEKTDFLLWSKGICPVCAHKPLMAKIRKEDSARILECRVCHTNWGFPRLECPFCDNKDHKKMRYLFIDEVNGRRVNVCEKCKNYIKTTLLKEIGRDVVLDLENLATLQLDSVAQEEGYKPGKDFHLLN